MASFDEGKKLTKTNHTYILTLSAAKKQKLSAKVHANTFLK